MRVRVAERESDASLTLIEVHLGRGAAAIIVKLARLHGREGVNYTELEAAEGWHEREPGVERRSVSRMRASIPLRPRLRLNAVCRHFATRSDTIRMRPMQLADKSSSEHGHSRALLSYTPSRASCNLVAGRRANSDETRRYRKSIGKRG